MHKKQRNIAEKETIPSSKKCNLGIVLYTYNHVSVLNELVICLDFYDRFLSI